MEPRRQITRFNAPIPPIAPIAPIQPIVDANQPPLADDEDNPVLMVKNFHMVETVYLLYEC
jgi:hypothetical protein